VTAGILLIAFAAQGCSEDRAASSSVSGSTAEVAVVTTTYPLEFLARKIGGPMVTVNNLVAPGVEPHDFEPSPQDMALLQRASMFLYNGGGLESWADRAAESLPASGPLVVVATSGMALASDAGAGEGVQGSQFDPHVWLDPELFSQQARTVANALSSRNPRDAATYNANLNSLLAGLAQLDNEFKQGLADCQRRTIVTSHSAFHYLATRYGLEQLALAGLSPESEPSPARLRALVQEVKASGATHVFYETLVEPRVAQTIAREAGAQVLVLNPLEGLTAEQARSGEDYFTLMRQNLANLRTALGCR
jgi:zinc transport system substrate-binding protein